MDETLSRQVAEEICYSDWLSAELAAAERRGAVRALRDAAEELLDSTIALDPERQTDRSYINCTGIDARKLNELADQIEEGT